MNLFFATIIFVILILIQQVHLQENSKRCRRRGDMAMGDGGGGGGGGSGLPDSCMTNSSGYMCCESGLEEVVNMAMDELKAEKEAQGEKFSSCNMQAMANKVGQMAERRFNTTFETVVGVSNFASNTRFFGNLMCKVSSGNKVILTYGTAKPPPPPAEEAEPQPERFKKVFHTFNWRL
uniref:Ground-like domain-containing protein n=1 Tax=Panagrolaimus davidi TaxID=227884 RepID=A0A914PSK2_9BILA